VFQIGQELLLAELPLTIRLIGLRVTKLKDLRTSDTSTGIKRVKDILPMWCMLFLLFSKFFEPAGPSSPHKKRRVSPSHTEESDSDEPEVSLLDDVSVPASVSESKRSKPTSSRKHTKERQPSVERETHTCPVCEKKVSTENDSFNAHLDSCLSREAIRQAQAQASASPKQGNIWERWTKMAPGSSKKSRTSK